MGRASGIICGVWVVLGLPAHAQEGSGLILGENFRGSSTPMTSQFMRSSGFQQSHRLVGQFPLTSFNPSIPEGIRLTGGLTWGASPLLSPHETLSNTTTRIERHLLNPNIQPPLDKQTSAFIGLGYTAAASMPSNWQLQADLGVTITLPAAPKPSDKPGGLENTLRDLRLDPSMQVRLFYSF